MNPRCGDNHGATLQPETRARLFLCGTFIQAELRVGVTSQRREQWPDPRGATPRGRGTPQEIPRSSIATEGSRRWLQQRSVLILNYLATNPSLAWSACDILQSCQEGRAPGPLDGERTTSLPHYRCQFWSKSIEVPNESYNVCCTSNSYRYSMRCPPRHLEEMKLQCCLELFGSELFVQYN